MRELRLVRGLTQESLAELAGANAKHLSLVELGKVNVSIDVLTRIAASLSVPVAELFGPVPRQSFYAISPRILDQVEQALGAIARVKRQRKGRTTKSADRTT